MQSLHDTETCKQCVEHQPHGSIPFHIIQLACSQRRIYSISKKIVEKEENAVYTNGIGYITYEYAQTKRNNFICVWKEHKVDLYSTIVGDCHYLIDTNDHKNNYFYNEPSQYTCRIYYSVPQHQQWIINQCL